MRFSKTIDLLNEYLESKNGAGKAEDQSKKNDRLLSFIKSVEKMSGKITSWSLAITGGTFLAILSEEYVHPVEVKFRTPYFLFVVGWIYIGISIYNGISISGVAAAAELNALDLDSLVQGSVACDKYFERQLRWFKLALLVFGIWLSLYLLWWIFGNLPIKLEKK
jgi:hypothetical protein